jgi:signal transduction histidine kinase
MPQANHRVLHERAQFLYQFGRDLERIADRQNPTRVLRFAMRRLGEFLGADLAVQADVRRTDGALERPFAISLTPHGAELAPDAENPVFLEPFRAFLSRQVGPADHTELLLRILSGERPVSVLGFLRPGRNFSRAETRLGIETAEILSENLRHRERERVQAQKERIYAKVLSEIRPKDVLYQILHGLKRLLEYDHSGAVLLLEAQGRELVVEAEIIAWTKAKSDRIGRSVALTEDLRSWLEGTTHPVLVSAGETPAGAHPLPGVLCEAIFDCDAPAAPDHPVTPGHLATPGHPVTPGHPTTLGHPVTPGHLAKPDHPGARAGMVAVLRHRSRTLGILTLRARSAAAFTPSDLQVLAEFLPLASITLYNSTLYKAQHDRLVSAERKTALADLARAISHDLNNAFGVMLPLLQAVRRDAAAGKVQAERLARDLEMIERYAQAGSRIFQGLLSVARGAAEPAGWSDLSLVLEAVSRMIGPSLTGKRIEVRSEFAPSLPAVYLRRSDMEQLFLNLVYNARDAMPGGGTLTLRCRADGGGDDEGVRIDVIDTGTGMSEEIRGRVFEPFFTTKEAGSGLGLDICRSIVWDYDGSIRIESALGRGTTVIVRLPRLAERLREQAERLDEHRERPSKRARPAAGGDDHGR